VQYRRLVDRGVVLRKGVVQEVRPGELQLKVSNATKGSHASNIVKIVTMLHASLRG
jgi:hypothetical protein